MNTQPQGQAVAPHGSEPEPASGGTIGAAPWNLVTRVGFRFSLTYIVLLYAFPFPLDSLPFGNFLVTHWANLWRVVVPWLGEHVLHLSYKIVAVNNGSGDTTFGYVKIFCFVVLAAIATIVWSIIDRRQNYARGYQWLQLYVRILLGAALLGYGAVKVIPTQMSSPPLSRLLTSCGDSAPMSLLWTFMGASRTYEIFTGVVEMLAGLLLFIPRLATLGALISTVAAANIFLLNISYDVPVKILSFHLLVMSLWLLIPEARRLVSFLILDRDVKHQAVRPFFQRKWLNTSILLAQVLFGLYLAVTSLNESYQTAKRMGFLAPKAPLYGIWIVDEFTVDGGAAPRPEDSMRWQRMIVDNNFVVAFQSVGGKWQRFIHQTDVEKKTITLWRRQSWLDKAKGQEIQISFDRLPTDDITLDGKFDGKQIHAKLHHIPEPQFVLNTRGFHWINEYPFNGYDE